MTPSPRACVGALACALALVAAMLVAGSALGAGVAGDITTIAGGATGLQSGPATDVGQGFAGVAVKGSRIYVADPVYNVVRLVDATTGQESVFAGTGVFGSLGDGGPATSAELASPAGLAVDGPGNLFVATDSRIRKVAVDDGTITTVAGSGTAGYGGDGLPATMALLASPKGVAVAPNGDLFIADTNNHRIRKVDSAGMITTVAGSGNASRELTFFGDGGDARLALLYRPTGVAVASNGEVFLADTGNNRVRKIDNSDPRVITTIAGTGSPIFTTDEEVAASDAPLFRPSGVAVNTMQGLDRLFISDTGNHRVRKVVAGQITTVAGSGASVNTAQIGQYSGDGGPATAARLDSPFQSAVNDQGDLLIADVGNARLRKVDGNSTITTVAGTGGVRFSGDGGPAILAQMSSPQGVDVDRHGNVFAADTGNNRARRVDTAADVSTVAGGGEPEPGFGDGGAATAAWVSQPQGIAVASNGDLFVTGGGIRRVSHGIITTVASGFSGVDLTLDGRDNLFFADRSESRVWVLNAASQQVTRVAGLAGNEVGGEGYSGDGGPATEARLNGPEGVAVDAAGSVYIADTRNHRIRKVTGGIITTVAGNGSEAYGGDGGPATAAALSGPGGVAIDASGNLLIADTGNHRIRRVDSAGIISTVAGTGTPGFGSDDGPATSAPLSSPHGIAVTAGGDLIIADTGNHRIRRVQAQDTPLATTAPAAPTGVGATAGDASATLNWAAPPSDGGSGLTSYIVTPYVGSTEQDAIEITGSPPPTTASIGGLTNGTTYTFTVSARNSVGTGPASAPSNAVTPSATSPGGTTSGSTTAPGSTTGPASAKPSRSGYWLVASDGGIFSFGDAAFRGSTGAIRLNQPIVGMAPTSSGNGYWLVASDGGIFAFGDAVFRGSTGAIRLNQPIVGMAATPSGRGYWLVASDGGIFAFGDAVFRGSTGAIRLNQAIVGMAATPSGKGYWLVASDGGIFAFGDAAFRGSTGGKRLNQPIVAMASSPSGNGYWLAASDGGIFAFGDAAFRGSAGAMKLAKPIVAMASSSSGHGYWLAASDGGIFAFGDAVFGGSTGALRINKPIVGTAATG